MIRRNNSGIMLLELMIALVVMGMIAVLLANALDFNRQSLDRARFLSDETKMLLSQYALRNWVEAMPLDNAGENTGELFKGDAQSMQFWTYVRDGTFQENTLTKFNLGVVSNEEERSLIVQGTGIHPLNEVEHEIERLLARNLFDLHISYYGRISTEPEPQWHDIWSDEIYLPDLVKIEWEIGEGVPLPPLTLQPGKTVRQSKISLSSLVPPG